MPDSSVISVRDDHDVIAARTAGRELAAELGFTMVDLVVIATAISEVARNIVRYGVQGAVELTPVERARTSGLEIVARDSGPGIEDVSTAMRDGYSTGGGLGLGLPGCQRLMDDFEITSAPGTGTTVRMRKWLH